MIDFEKIADKFNVNIRLFETIRKNVQDIWQMVYGKNKFKESRKSIDIGLYVDKSKQISHCFYIKDIELLTTHWNCKGCGQRFERHGNYHRHVSEDRCTGGKTNVICNGKKFRKIMCWSEKVFYGANTQDSLKGCRWIEGVSFNTKTYSPRSLWSWR